MSEQHSIPRGQTITLNVPHTATLNGLPTTVLSIHAGHNPFRAAITPELNAAATMTLQTSYGEETVWGYALMEFSGDNVTYHFFRWADVAFKLSGVQRG